MHTLRAFKFDQPDIGIEIELTRQVGVRFFFRHRFCIEKRDPLALLRHFGSVAAIKEASLEELTRTPGLPGKVAAKGLYPAGESGVADRAFQGLRGHSLAFYSENTGGPGLGEAGQGETESAATSEKVDGPVE